MIVVYYKSGAAQWKYELEDDEYKYVIGNILEDAPDPQEMFDDSLEILRDLSSMDEDEMDEDDQVDQTIAVAYLWHWFNHIAQGDERIDGDIALIEDEDGAGVAVLPAADLVEE